MENRSVKVTLRAELEATRVAFHALLAALSDDQLAKQSVNPAWTNQHMLFHMAFGFLLLLTLIPLARLFGRLPPAVSKAFARLLNATTRPFNWINARVPQLGGIILSRRALATTFDWVYARILHQLAALPEDELQRGMYYPDKWEPLFREYMTLEDIFRYPTLHFQSHVQHIAA
jgi:hypothetical protein